MKKLLSMSRKTQISIGLIVSLCLLAVPISLGFNLVHAQSKQSSESTATCQQTKDADVEALANEVADGMIGVLDWQVASSFAVDFGSANAESQIEAIKDDALDLIADWSDYYSDEYAMIQFEFQTCIGSIQNQNE